MQRSNCWAYGIVRAEDVPERAGTEGWNQQEQIRLGQTHGDHDSAVPNFGEELHHQLECLGSAQKWVHFTDREVWGADIERNLLDQEIEGRERVIEEGQWGFEVQGEGWYSRSSHVQAAVWESQKWDFSRAECAGYLRKEIRREEGLTIAITPKHGRLTGNHQAKPSQIPNEHC